MALVFRNREEAGRLLGEALKREGISGSEVRVLGIPRGGVITAKAASEVVGGQLDVIVSRKLRAPFNPELGLGAVSELEAVYINWDIVRELGVGRDYLDREVEYQREVVKRYVEKFRLGSPLSLRGTTAVVVDDGIATGATVIAASIACRNAGAERVVVAAPVVSEDVAPIVSRYCDRLVYVIKPAVLYAVGMYYEDFSEVSDEEVLRLLGRSRQAG
ncbi:MAG: phosphoribosyltransferase family protein [Thermofilum sp.]